MQDDGIDRRMEPFTVDELFDSLESIGIDCSLLRMARPMMAEADVREALLNLLKARLMIAAHYEESNVCHWCGIDYPSFTERCLRCDNVLHRGQGSKTKRLG